MAGHSPTAHASQRQFPARILSYTARAILGTLMSLAVAVLERRIRKALRSKAGPGRPAGQVGEGGT